MLSGKAIKIFNDKNLDLVIHAGDLISPFTALEFQKLDSRTGCDLWQQRWGERRIKKCVQRNLSLRGLQRNFC